VGVGVVCGCVFANSVVEDYCVRVCCVVLI